MDFTTLERATGRTAASPELPVVVTEMLADIASGARRLQAVEHPLGFVCLPVVREDERGVCVHIFESGPQGLLAPPTAAQVHCHSWELTSSVLYGEIGNLRARVLDEPDRPTHRVFEVSSSGSGVDEIRPTSRLVRWEPAGEQTSARGETYTLPPGEFHATFLPDGASAATLVLGRSLPDHVDLVLGPVDGPPRRMLRRPCGAGQTARIAREAARRINEPRRTE